MSSIFEEMQSLKEMHNVISNQLLNKKVAYIDIPTHYNTGDLLIYLGTEAFIKNHDVNVVYRALQRSVNHKKMVECDVIMVHGGGNFGDIYIKEHRIREGILKKYTDKEIVFLPQSIHFDSNLELKKTVDFLKGFKNVTFYTRDIESFNTAKLICDNVVMMPDMAHSLHPLIEESELVDINKLQKKILNLVRKDKEFVIKERKVHKLSFDWSDLCSPVDILLMKVINFMGIFHRLDKLKMNVWNMQVNLNVKTAIDKVYMHDVVYTDRLHGFILSYLLGKEIVMYDNSYGKINKYVTNWIAKSETIKNENE